MHPETVQVAVLVAVSLQVNVHLCVVLNPQYVPFDTLEYVVVVTGAHDWTEQGGAAYTVELEEFRENKTPPASKTAPVKMIVLRKVCMDQTRGKRIVICGNTTMMRLHCTIFQ